MSFCLPACIYAILIVVAVQPTVYLPLHGFAYGLST